MLAASVDLEPEGLFNQGLVDAACSAALMDKQEVDKAVNHYSDYKVDHYPLPHRALAISFRRLFW